jgi:amidohydrolase
MEQIITGIAQAMECTATFEVESITPVVVNDAAMSDQVRQLAASIPPVNQIVGDERSMGSDDASFMMETVPSCYFFVGSANAEKGLNFGHHHPRFDFDERALSIGAALMASAAAHYVLK